LDKQIGSLRFYWPWRSSSRFGRGERYGTLPPAVTASAHWSTLGIKVYLWLFSVWLAFGLADGDDLNFLAILGLPLPIFVSFYAVASIVLLWPWISQKNAMLFAKILHLIIFPIFYLIIFTGEFAGHRGNALFDLQWLAYGPLWFRIHESFVKDSRSH
jgi:hypothetical protein